MRTIVALVSALCGLVLLGPPARAAAPAPAPVLACGQIRCQSNADCPSECGPCVTWSGTCALFGPR